MYAIIVTGGKQYKVKENQVISVEHINGEVGEKVALDKVLFVADNGESKIGAPLVDGAVVHAEVTAQEKGKKIKVIKFKRRKNYHRKQGHRQLVTKLKITAIQAS